MAAAGGAGVEAADLFLKSLQMIINLILNRMTVVINLIVIMILTTLKNPEIHLQLLSENLDPLTLHLRLDHPHYILTLLL